MFHMFHVNPQNIWHQILDLRKFTDHNSRSTGFFA
jgi:hypothetical protein